MTTIYKYEIPLRGVTVELPSVSKPLCVGVQDGKIMIWIELDTANFLPKIHREFEVFGTGHDMRQDMGVSRTYVGTAFIDEFVWHIYERH